MIGHADLRSYRRDWKFAEINISIILIRVPRAIYNMRIHIHAHMENEKSGILSTYRNLLDCDVGVTRNQLHRH
jgi:hypothetical protein